MRKNLNQGFGASHGPGDYLLHPGEFSTELKWVPSVQRGKVIEFPSAPAKKTA